MAINPEKILVLTNLQGLVDIKPTGRLMSSLLSVIDTGVGRNFVRKSELLSGREDLISFGPTEEIKGANNRPLRLLDLGHIESYSSGCKVDQIGIFSSSCKVEQNLCALSFRSRTDR